MRIAGIDFGAKTAGTTVICSGKNGTFDFYRTPRGRDADESILAWVDEHKPAMVGIDAPLSLPGVYRSLDGYRDYFYRDCDREMSAMSPMFLGGLTARAMRVKEQLEERGVEVLEVYPAGLVRHFRELEPLYTPRAKTSTDALEAFCRVVSSLLRVTPQRMPQSWHDVDSLLALASTSRYTAKEAIFVGAPEEGVIVI